MLRNRLKALFPQSPSFHGLSAASLFSFLAVIVYFGMYATAKAFGQELPAPPSIDEWQALIVSLGGLKGASALTVAGIVTQAVMLLWRTNLSKFSGQFRLIVFLLVSVVSSLIALKASGLDWAAALAHSSSLTAYQALGFAIYKQFFTKKGLT